MLKTRNTLKFIIFFRTNFGFSHIFGIQSRQYFRNPKKGWALVNCLSLTNKEPVPVGI